MHVDAAAFFADRLRAENAVGTHAGENDGERVGTKGGGDGAEEDVDGGAVNFQGRLLIHREMNAGMARRSRTMW